MFRSRPLRMFIIIAVEAATHGPVVDLALVGTAEVRVDHETG